MKVLIGVLVVVLIAAMILLPVIGYISNIVKLCHCDFDAPLKAEVVRGIGVVIPVVGMITGYMDINDEPDKETATTQKTK